MHQMPDGHLVHVDSERMSPPLDLRSWIALLEREGELVRVDAEVDPDLWGIGGVPYSVARGPVDAQPPAGDTGR